MAVFTSEGTTETLEQPALVKTNAEISFYGIRREAETPAVFSAASKSVEFSDRLRSHCRETRRIPAEIPSSVELVLLDGTVYDTGNAILRNISPSGALLASLELDRGNFPAALFKIRLVLKGDPYAGIGIEATPVRFASGTLGIGIKFDEIFVAV